MTDTFESKKLITVVIPNYNGKQFLIPCINALSKQTNKSFNVIVVDNGSSDGSIEYLKEQNILTKKGNTQYKNHKNVLTVIKTLGNSGDKNAMDQLIIAKNAGWPKDISQAADDALNTLLTE